FIATAIAIYFVMPATYFALVAICKRCLLWRITARDDVTLPSVHHRCSHWLYGKLIDVPFFNMYLRINIMSHLSKWNYQSLGSRIGKRPFLGAPYTPEPELLEIGDYCMLAGNVSLYGVDPRSNRADKISLGDSAVVANTCILQ